MSYLPTSADLHAVARAVKVLVSPLDHDSVDEWRDAVNEHLKVLLRADTAGFLLPVSEGLPLYSAEHDPAALARYTEYPPPPTVGGQPVWERVLDLRVATIDMVYQPDVDRYLSSPYYNEYAGTNGAHDTLVAAVPLAGREPHDSAALHFWHDDPAGERFDERERALLTVLHPALDAGARIALRTEQSRASLGAWLEVQRDGALVYEANGRVLFSNRAVRRLPLSRSAHSALLAAGDDMARAVTGGDPQELLAPTTLTRTLQLSGRTHELSAVELGPGVFAHRPVVLVTVAAGRAPLPGLDTLRSRFGLTRRQAEVALLLARRRTDPEIAAHLCISPYTARHHTEAVLGRLGIGDRRDVAGVISSTDDE